MKKLLCFMTVILAMCMTVSLSACGGGEPTPTEPEGEKPYIIKVVDDAGNAIPGVMVQLCSDSCYPGKTDSDGMAEFKLSADTYKASVLALPAGFDYMDETREFYFEEGSRELTIVLKSIA
mgnify:CR=1 FL=1